MGVGSRLNTAQVGYLQTLSLFGRTSNIVVELPYTWGTTVGTLEGEPARRDLSGVGPLHSGQCVGYDPSLRTHD